eukprot:TRINITY_DN5126_c0_g1_i1.p1 TRINITY_DN5126_c0_g1~~TRINITY_DN5126_c0_g1_i1.p1  ORF type:complete len:531 (-),score=43.21 TRINITY_DN5126_c0_g1_i1:162-1754(-)
MRSLACLLISTILVAAVLTSPVATLEWVPTPSLASLVSKTGLPKDVWDTLHANLAGSKSTLGSSADDQYLLVGYENTVKPGWSAVVAVSLATGKIVGGRRFPGRSWAPVFADVSTISFLQTDGDTRDDHRSVANALIWNFKEGSVRKVKLTHATHSIDYDPNTQRVWWLKAVGNPLKCNRLRVDPSCMLVKKRNPRLTAYHVDDLVATDARTGSERWNWNCTHHFLGSGSVKTFPTPINLARLPQEWGRIDATHLNKVIRQFPQSLVVSSRSLSSVYRIDRSSGKVMWGVGKFGTLRSISLEGKQVQSLFYGPHDITPTGKANTYLIFDNNWDTEKWPQLPLQGANSNGVLNTRLIEFEVDLVMREARETWRWEPGIAWGRLNGGGVTHSSELDHLVFGAFERCAILGVRRGQEHDGPQFVLRFEGTHCFIYTAEMFYGHPQMHVMGKITLAQQTISVLVHSAIHTPSSAQAQLRVFSLCTNTTQPPVKLLLRPFFGITRHSVKIPPGAVELTLHQGPLMRRLRIHRPCP